MNRIIISTLHLFCLVSSAVTTTPKDATLLLKHRREKRQTGNGVIDLELQSHDILSSISHQHSRDIHQHQHSTDVHQHQHSTDIHQHSTDVHRHSTDVHQPHTVVSHAPRPPCSKLDCEHEFDCFPSQSCSYDPGCRRTVCSSRRRPLTPRRRVPVYCIMHSCENIAECGSGQECTYDPLCEANTCKIVRSNRPPVPRVRSNRPPVPRVSSCPYTSCQRTGNCPLNNNCAFNALCGTLVCVPTSSSLEISPQPVIPARCADGRCLPGRRCPLGMNCEFDSECRSNICKPRLPSNCSENPCFSNRACGSGRECLLETSCGYRVCKDSTSTTCVYTVCDNINIRCNTGQVCVFDQACNSFVCKSDTVTGVQSCFKPPCASQSDCGSGQICQFDISCGNQVCVSSTELVRRECARNVATSPSCTAYMQCTSNNDCSIGEICCRDMEHRCGDICRVELSPQNRGTELLQNNAIEFIDPTKQNLPSAVDTRIVNVWNDSRQSPARAQVSLRCLNARNVTARYCGMSSCLDDSNCEQNYECCPIDVCSGQRKLCVRKR